MRADVRAALAISRSSTMEDRTVDITTTGRRSGKARRIEIVFDPAERRRVLANFVDEFNHRHDPDSPWGVAVLDQWVEGSPLARVRFLEAD
jgi:hypothetical protein